MAPLIPDGIYKIRSAQYTNLVTDLLNGDPLGSIFSLNDSPDNKNDKWRIRNQGSGGNQITIESASVHGSYANAAQSEGAYLNGGNSPMIWTVVKADGGNYILQSPDANYVWKLPRGAEFVIILLVNQTGDLDTKWSFDPVPE